MNAIQAVPGSQSTIGNTIPSALNIREIVACSPQKAMDAIWVVNRQWGTQAQVYVSRNPQEAMNVIQADLGSQSTIGNTSSSTPDIQEIRLA